MGYLDAVKYRQEIIDAAKISNEEAQTIMDKAIADGYQITLYTRLCGPYTEIVNYWLSNGVSVQFTEPAPLHWVPMDIIKWW